MVLRDILTKPYKRIVERAYLPADLGGGDTFTGVCAYDGENLISLDGDSYSLDAPIIRYETDESNEQLTYWYEAGICTLYDIAIQEDGSYDDTKPIRENKRLFPDT